MYCDAGSKSFNKDAKENSASTPYCLTPAKMRLKFCCPLFKASTCWLKTPTFSSTFVKACVMSRVTSFDKLLKDLLPASQYITNVKIKPEETSENVEFAVRLQDGVLCPIDSHWPIEKFKAIDDAYQNKNKQMLNDAKKVLASAFRDKAKKVAQKYISQPKTTYFAIVYAPTEGLFSELASYRDPNTKELLTQELIKKYKITIMGPNTLSAFLQALHMGFQTLKVQKHATQIHDDLKIITTRFDRHFDGIKDLRKKLEEAIGVTDNFGRDARSIMRTLENIKDPEEVEKAIKEDIDKVKVINK